MDGELAATADGKILGLRVNVIADHGAFDACADPTKYPAGMFHICRAPTTFPAAWCSVKGVYTEQGAGRRGLSLLVPCHRGRVRHRAHGGHPGAEAGHGQGGDPREELHPQGAVSLHLGLRASSTTRATTEPALHKVLDACDYKGLRAEQAAKRADPNCPTLMGIGLVAFTEMVGAGPTQDVRHPRRRHVRQLRDPRASHRQCDRAHGHDQSGPGTPDDLRADHRHRSSASLRR